LGCRPCRLNGPTLVPCQILSQLDREPICVLCLTFPDNQYGPAAFFQSSDIAPVSGNVALSFDTPEIRTRLWHDSPVFAPVHVPEASVHEDYFSCAREDNVRLSWKVWPIKAVPEAHLVKQGPDDALGLSIATPNAGHAQASLCGSKNVRHERALSDHKRDR
jgi:hypothetical protein